MTSLLHPLRSSNDKTLLYYWRLITNQDSYHIFWKNKNYSFERISMSYFICNNMCLIFPYLYSCNNLCRLFTTYAVYQIYHNALISVVYQHQMILKRVCKLHEGEYHECQHRDDSRKTSRHLAICKERDRDILIKLANGLAWRKCSILRCTVLRQTKGFCLIWLYNYINICTKTILIRWLLEDFPSTVYILSLTINIYAPRQWYGVSYQIQQRYAYVQSVWLLSCSFHKQKVTLRDPTYKVTTKLRWWG